jgi:hypothetical protein
MPPPQGRRRSRPGRRPGVEIFRLGETMRALESLGVEVEDLKDVMGSISAEGARLAAEYAPVRSGKLRKSIRGNRAKSRAAITAGKKRVPYAGPINFGWRKRHIQPSEFMQRADRALQARVPEMLTEGIQRLINERNLSG